MAAEEGARGDAGFAEPKILIERHEGRTLWFGRPRVYLRVLHPYTVGSAANQKLPFALYGGFFSVMAGTVGLVGSSHGIGYGEYRAWPELPRSGPPPARYYLRQLHRYIAQEDAQRLWMADRNLASCPCNQCMGRAPIELEYHDLMRHSVECGR
jgi:hypothetical protein